jgi:predicted TIM-barrel fold metal-dependent hydrolase
MIADAHCHFFSAGFFRTLGSLPGVQDTLASADAAEALPERLGWDPPGDDRDLADRWMTELDRHGVMRVMLMSSLPGDEHSVAAAVAAYPERVVGGFMVNPAAADAPARVERAFSDGGL